MDHGSEHSSLEIEVKFTDLQISCSLEVEEVDKEERLWTAQLLPNLKAVCISQICLWYAPILTNKFT